MCIIFAHAFTCIHIFIHTYIYVHIYIYVYALTLIHTDAKKIGEVVEEMAGARLIYRYIYTYTFTNTYIHTFKIYTYTCTCTYIQLYTYLHTRGANMVRVGVEVQGGWLSSPASLSDFNPNTPFKCKKGSWQYTFEVQQRVVTPKTSTYNNAFV